MFFLNFLTLTRSAHTPRQLTKTMLSQQLKNYLLLSPTTQRNSGELNMDSANLKLKLTTTATRCGLRPPELNHELSAVCPSVSSSSR